MCRASLILLLFITPSLFGSKTIHPLFPEAGVKSRVSSIPSALWPQFIETARDLTGEEAQGKRIPERTRGVLLRVEGDQLLIDFGRQGVVSVEPNATSFYDEVYQLMSGESEKEFPNFALQIGNKMMTFGRGKDSGPIRFGETKELEVYILLYLDAYFPEYAAELIQLGDAYEDLKENWPSLEVVLMPRERAFYDFGASVGYPVPYIAPHMRIGYIESLSHGVAISPAFVAVDNNGRILGRSADSLKWNNLTNSLEKLVNEIGISWNWNAHKVRKKRAYQRTSAWNH